MNADGFYCPIFPGKSFKYNFNRGKLRYVDDELEMRCSRCAEWWPADTEFFHAQAQVLCSWCVACTCEMKRLRREDGLTAKDRRAA